MTTQPEQKGTAVEVTQIGPACYVLNNQAVTTLSQLREYLEEEAAKSIDGPFESGCNTVAREALRILGGGVEE